MGKHRSSERCSTWAYIGAFGGTYVLARICYNQPWYSAALLSAVAVAILKLISTRSED